jgi:hypothetical protein
MVSRIDRIKALIKEANALGIPRAAEIAEKSLRELEINGDQLVPCWTQERKPD